MLVLTVREGQELVLGDEEIIIKVLSMGETVKLGIAAPPQLSVHREKIYNLLKAIEKKKKGKSGAISEGLQIKIPRVPVKEQKWTKETKPREENDNDGNC